MVITLALRRWYCWKIFIN